MLWQPAFFGAKPELVLKGGMIAWSQMGDPNASIPTPQPVVHAADVRQPSAARSGRSSVAFVSEASRRAASVERYGLTKRVEPVRGCRSLGKKDMKLNDATPRIEVDPETYRVTADGEHLTCQPAAKLALAQRYFLF